MPINFKSQNLKKRERDRERERERERERRADLKFCDTKFHTKLNY